MTVRSLIIALLASGLMQATVATSALAQPTPTPVPMPTQAAPAQTNTAQAPQVSLSLHDALALALANNLSYQTALADERVAEGGVVQARAGLLPQLSAGYS